MITRTLETLTQHDWLLEANRWQVTVHLLTDTVQVTHQLLPTAASRSRETQHQPNKQSLSKECQLPKNKSTATAQLCPMEVTCQQHSRAMVLTTETTTVLYSLMIRPSLINLRTFWRELELEIMLVS